MTNILKNSPKIVTLFFLLSACSKEKIANIVWQQVSPKANVAWRDVGFRNDSVAYAVGGTNWNIGMAAQTTDGGRTWRTDSVAEKQLRAVTFDADGKAYAGGIDGYLLDKTDAANPWNFYRQQHWESITDMVFYDAEHGVAVGGIAYQNGVILPIAGKNFAQIGYQLLLKSFKYFRIWFE